MTDGDFQKHAEQVEQLVARATALADDGARTTALELLQATMDLHGAVVTRMVEILEQSGEAGASLLKKLGADPLICGLLVLYGIHPVSLQDRVAGAVESVRRQIAKDGAGLDLLQVSESMVRVAVRPGQGCGSSPDALKLTVEQAIREAAPEITEVLVEGGAASGFVPLHMIQPASSEEKKYEESAA